MPHPCRTATLPVPSAGGICTFRTARKFSTYCTQVPLPLQVRKYCTIYTYIRVCHQLYATNLSKQKWECGTGAAFVNVRTGLPYGTPCIPYVRDVVHYHAHGGCNAGAQPKAAIENTAKCGKSEDKQSPTAFRGVCSPSCRKGQAETMTSAVFSVAD